MINFKVGPHPPNVDKLIIQSENDEFTNIKQVLNKYSKNNIKLSVPLDAS